MTPTKEQWDAALELLRKAKDEIREQAGLAEGDYFTGNGVADEIGEFLNSVDSQID